MTRTRWDQLTGIWFALAILLGVATFAYRSVDAAADTLGWVERANEALRGIGDVSAAYARSTSARRAYIVTGDSSQLVELPELDAKMARAIDAVRVPLADDSAQLRRLDSLAHLLELRLESLDASIDRRRREGTGIETAEGLTLAARVRAIREEMEAEERRLLAVRDSRTRQDITLTKVTTVLGTVASIALLLLAFGRLRAEVTRRQRSEQALRANEGFLDSIVENIPDMVFVKEASALRFERINRAGEELLGITRSELIGKNDFDFFPREQAEFFQARDRKTLQDRTIEEIAEEPIQTNAGERWLRTKKVPIFDEDGKPKYLLGISDDITATRKAAAALRAAKEAAESANQELEAFSYSVAHDLRAPLRAIAGFAQVLQEDCAAQLDAEGVGYLARVRSATAHMSQLIDGLLGLSRVARTEIVREKVDLTKVARESAARLIEAHPTRRVDVVIQPGVEVEADARLLVAALDNLLGNAWKFTSKRPDARVEVGARVEEGRQVIYVRDNGAGFDPAFADKLFRAFQRLHPAKDFDGTGIGLATVQRIARRHGGRVWAEGAVDRGATFYFTL